MIRVNEPDKKAVEYRLHGKGSWKPFGDDQLDNGIVAYVRCFGQLEAKLKERFPNKVTLYQTSLLMRLLVEQIPSLPN
jgi:hypothetical protein